MGFKFKRLKSNLSLKRLKAAQGIGKAIVDPFGRAIQAVGEKGEHIAKRALKGSSSKHLRRAEQWWRTGDRIKGEIGKKVASGITGGASDFVFGFIDNPKRIELPSGGNAGFSSPEHASAASTEKDNTLLIVAIVVVALIALRK